MDNSNRILSRKEILTRCGSTGQIAGARKMIVEEGRAGGCSLIRVRNGLGLDFSILPDRGMDIYEAYYNGIPLAWISGNGLTGPGNFDDRGTGWLRNFNGGMLVTCGMRNVGPPCDADGEHFGLHGRFTSIPAENVNIRQRWKGEEYLIEIEGDIRESSVFGEQLLCHRSIRVSNLDNEIQLHDRIVNEGFRTETLALLYHFNWGFPLFSEHARLELDPVNTRDRDSGTPGTDWDQFQAPIPDFSEVVYLHELRPDRNGNSSYHLKDPLTGIGVCVSWPKQELPFFTQWKMTGEGEYVLGLEPGNCFPNGRVRETAEGRCESLAHLETKEIYLTIGITG